MRCLTTSPMLMMPTRGAVVDDRHVADPAVRHHLHQHVDRGVLVAGLHDVGHDRADRVVDDGAVGVQVPDDVALAHDPVDRRPVRSSRRPRPRCARTAARAARGHRRPVRSSRPRGSPWPGGRRRYAWVDGSGGHLGRTPPKRVDQEVDVGRAGDRAGPTPTPVRCAARPGSSASSGSEPRKDSAASWRCPLVASTLPPEGAVGAVEGGEPAAGLAHDHVERRHVVELELGLGRDVHGPLGEQHVGPEVAVRPGAPAPAHQRQEVVQPAALVPASQRRVGRTRRPRAGARRRPGSGSPSAATARSRHRCRPTPTNGAAGAGRDHPRTTSSSTTSEINVAHGHPADEVLGAVDRVHHPAALAVPGRAVLLAGHRVARPHPRASAGSTPRPRGRRR